MSLMTEEKLNEVVQVMCSDGHYEGAAELIETWVMEELADEVAQREAEKKARQEVLEQEYNNTPPIDEEVKALFEKPFFEQLAEVHALVNEANGVQETKSVKSRMSEEFGKDTWGGN